MTPAEQTWLDKLNAWRALTPQQQDAYFVGLVDQELTPGDYPSLGRMALNLGKAVVAHVADGGRHAPQDVQDARLVICQVCPSFDGPANRCQICGCMLSVKRSWASSVCPDDPPRWEAV